MSWIARVAHAIVRRVCLEAVERLLPACGKRPVVAVMRIIALIDVAIKSVRSVEPGAGADEHSA
jgi:hypothetical protein